MTFSGENFAFEKNTVLIKGESNVLYIPIKTIFVEAFGLCGLVNYFNVKLQTFLLLFGFGFGFKTKLVFGFESILKSRHFNKCNIV